MHIIVTISGHQYDVTQFIPQHPGEKTHKNRSIFNYPGQDITTVFEMYHAKPTRKHEALYILEQSRIHGEYSGVKYLGKI